jgi:hypothetical protein
MLYSRITVYLFYSGSRSACRARSCEKSAAVPADPDEKPEEDEDSREVRSGECRVVSRAHLLPDATLERYATVWLIEEAPPIVRH